MLACFEVATAGETDTPQRERPPQEILESRFSRMRGMRVENVDAQHLGSLKDFVVEIRTGDAKYALVAPSGLQNIRARSRIVPAHLLSNATAKESTISLDISLERWKNSPRIRKSELEGLNDPAREQQIQTYYLLTPAAPEKPREAGAKLKTREKEKSKAAEMKLASDLLGSKVINLQNQPMGRISDLLIDLKGKKGAFVVVSESKLLKKNEKFVAPLRGAHILRAGELAIQASGLAFEQARPFNDQAWQALGTADWKKVYRFAD